MCQKSWCENTSQSMSCCYKTYLWTCTHLLWVATRNISLAWPDASRVQTQPITFLASSDTPARCASVPWPRPGLGWDGSRLGNCVANHCLKTCVAHTCLGVGEAALHWDDGSHLGEKGDVSSLEAEHTTLHVSCTGNARKVAWQNSEDPASSPET